jgi:hypothetical protein
VASPCRQPTAEGLVAGSSPDKPATLPRLPLGDPSDRRNVEDLRGTRRYAICAIVLQILVTELPHDRIAISQAAFDAIAATLAIGSTGYENATNEKGERLVCWTGRSSIVFGALRGPGESYSDAIYEDGGESA